MSLLPAPMTGFAKCCSWQECHSPGWAFPTQSRPVCRTASEEGPLPIRFPVSSQNSLSASDPIPEAQLAGAQDRLALLTWDPPFQLQQVPASFWARGPEKSRTREKWKRLSSAALVLQASFLGRRDLRCRPCQHKLFKTATGALPPRDRLRQWLLGQLWSSCLPLAALPRLRIVCSSPRAAT